MNSPPELPHYRRLLARIESQDAPLVVLHGWPGAGVRGFLAFLSAQTSIPALTLSASRVESILGGDAFDAEVRLILVDQTARRSWRPSLDRLVDRLGPHQSLVLASHGLGELQELASEFAVSVLGPSCFLLDLEEARELASATSTGALASDDSSADLEVEIHFHRTGGWLEPLRCLLQATRAEALLEEFLESSVLAPLPDAARSWLRACFAGRPPDFEQLPEAMRDLLIECGYADRSGRPRVPPLLFGRELKQETGVQWRAPGTVDFESATPAREARAGIESSSVATVPAPSPVAGLPRFEIKLLGVPRIEACAGDSRQEVVWSLKRAIHLLALLCSRPGLAAGRDEVIETLWPDENQDAVERNLHPTVSLLRRALRVASSENPILLRNGIYRLSPSYEWSIDTVRFERAILTGRTLGAAGGEPHLASWEEAWRLYSGPFMVGHDTRFIIERREELQRLYLGMLRDLGDAYFAQKRHSDAEDAFRSILNVDPVQESVHVSIMEIYADRGRRDLVRKQYERLCNLLQEELGVDPLPATATDYHRLMS